MNTNEHTKSSDIEIPKTSITVYGGKKADVSSSIAETLDLSDDEYYSTWINLGIMRRLGFLFEGGVESAGSVCGLVVMFIVLVATLALFALWNLAVVFVVIAALTLLSGGSAFKFLRATYITKPLSEMDSIKIEQFVVAQVSQGHFVRLEGKNESKGMGIAIQEVSSATLLFRRGIQFSLFVATVFLILEVLYLFMTGHWLSGLNPVTGPTEMILLIYFGLMFSCGVILMDLGVLLRYRVSKGLSDNTKGD